MKMSYPRLNERRPVGCDVINEIDKNRRATPMRYLRLQDRPAGIPKQSINTGGLRKQSALQKAKAKITLAGRGIRL